MHMFYSLSLFCPSQDAKLYCGGNYVDVSENNTECVTIMNTIMDVSVLPSSIRIVVYLFGCKKSERFGFCVDIAVPSPNKPLPDLGAAVCIFIKEAGNFGLGQEGSRSRNNEAPHVG